MSMPLQHFRNLLINVRLILACSLVWCGLWLTIPVSAQTEIISDKPYYIAFVAYQPKNSTEWQVPPIASTIQELQVGDYSFQIVFHWPNGMPKPINVTESWFALRGKFEVNQQDNKLLIITRKTLDAGTGQAQAKSAPNRSLWSKDTWTSHGRPWLKSLAPQIELTSDLDFLRVLSGDQPIEKTNQFTLVRLYRYQIPSSGKLPEPEFKDFVKNLASFIDQKNQNDNLETLISMLDAQSNFKLAGYLESPDADHAEFYNYFKDWVHQFANAEPFKSTEGQPPPSGHSGGTTSYSGGTTTTSSTSTISPITLGGGQNNQSGNPSSKLVMIIVILTIAVAWLFYLQYKNNLRKLFHRVPHSNDTLNDSSWPDDAVSGTSQSAGRFPRNISHSYSQSKQPESEKPFDKYAERLQKLTTEIDSLKTTVQNLQSNLNSLLEWREGVDLQEDLDTNRTNINMLLSPLADTVSKLNNRLHQVENSLYRVEINCNQASGRVSELSSKLDNLRKQYIDIAVAHTTAPVLPSEKPLAAMQPAPTYSEPKKQADNQARSAPSLKPAPTISPLISEEIKNLKSALLSLSAVSDDKLCELDKLVERESQELCEFVCRLVADYLTTNKPIAHYRRVDKAVQQASNEQVSLIIPDEGEKVLSEQHQVVLQQPVEKGSLNTIFKLIRPGVRCGTEVKRRAEVIETI